MSEEASTSPVDSPSEETAKTPMENLDSPAETSTPASPISSENPNQLVDTAQKSISEKPPASTPLSKIEVIFKPAGDAPILKQAKWVVPLSKTIGWVHGNIRKYLKMEPSESLFIYIRQSFSPSLDQTIENLYNCFGSGDGKLIVHYRKTQAWG